MADDYLVVFEYTKEAGAYAGNRYYTCFDNSEDFKQTCTDEWLAETNQKVVEAGVSVGRAGYLCSSVPLGPRIRALMQEYEDVPEVIPTVLAIEVSNR
ncbi:hypothetical protein KC887_09250 [Candidatus Kaiserbacteria bacterium]|nr:hypothetical protein [Candidatus Kaiserbacteria bacterium]